MISHGRILVPTSSVVVDYHRCCMYLATHSPMELAHHTNMIFFGIILYFYIEARHCRSCSLHACCTFVAKHGLIEVIQCKNMSVIFINEKNKTKLHVTWIEKDNWYAIPGTKPVDTIFMFIKYSRTSISQ